jgi:glycosyltransferase involved in cell wall biosynthesis
VKKICYIVTKPSTIEAFFIPQLQYLSGHGYDVTVVCDYSDYLQDKLGNGIRYVPVNIPRGISIGGSVLAIRSLTEFFKKEKFNMIQYSTPNAALYASIAAKKAGIKIRNYHIMGFRYLGSSGIGRMVLKKVEKITCRNSTSIECVSRSNLESGVREKIFDKKKAAVVWNGSSGGIDLKKFNCEYREQYRDKIRKKYGINKNDFVFGFVGRITKDKGVNEILKAFSGINDAKLMMVGDPEATDTLDQKLYTDTLKNNNVIYTGNVTEIEQYYSAIDVLLLPSYREGFGNAVIEAGAMGTPSIISNIPGPKDAVIPNETALVIEPQDPDALLEAMKKMMGGKVTEMGNAAADHVRKSFDSEKLNEFILERKDELFEGVRDAKSIHHYGRL